MKQHLTREMILSTLQNDHLSDDTKASEILALAYQDQTELLNRVSNSMSEAFDDVQDSLNQLFIREGEID